METLIKAFYAPDLRRIAAFQREALLLSGNAVRVNR